MHIPHVSLQPSAKHDFIGVRQLVVHVVYLGLLGHLVLSMSLFVA